MMYVWDDLLMVVSLTFFFFSSRRRHTRCGRDWSSDVCSSDLGGLDRVGADADHVERGMGLLERLRDHPDRGDRVVAALVQIGRASCRGRGEISGGAASFKKKKKRPFCTVKYEENKGYDDSIAK